MEKSESVAVAIVPASRISPSRGGVWRKIAESGVWALTMVIVLRTWCVEGLFLPLVVPSGSMAETLMGTHRTVVCDGCGFHFNCGSDAQPPRRAVCPNCGSLENDLSALVDVSGDRIFLNRLAFTFRRPQAWEVVAFRDPRQSEQVVVKRVVGLPGETITLVNGDVYADGKIRRKPFWLQRAMAVLVHDAFCSTGRWRGRELLEAKEVGAKLEASNQATGESQAVVSRMQWVTDHWISDGAWSYAEGRFTHAADRRDCPVDWLEFCPGRPIVKSNSVNTDCGEMWICEPVTDLCGYNQTQPRRVEDIHTVDDLMLSIRVRHVHGCGKMFVRASDAVGEFMITFTFRRQDGRSTKLGGELMIEASRDGRPLHDVGKVAVKLPDSFAEQGVPLTVSLFDNRLLVAVVGQEMVSYDYEPGSDPSDTKENQAHATRRPLAIGSDGLGLVLDAVRVYRDVYYAYPANCSKNQIERNCVKLGADEYYMLGDNSAISVDSRNWEGGGAVSHKLLLGKPLAAFCPNRPVEIGGWHFQVPYIGRIRYIR